MPKKSTKTTHTTLSKLMKQNKEQLKEYCSKKYFTRIVTFEEVLTKMLQDKTIKKALKTMSCQSAIVNEPNDSGKVFLTFVFSNDDCEQKVRELFEVIGRLMN